MVYNPNPVPHATIFLSNISLRNLDDCYTAHWRPGNECRLPPLSRRDAQLLKSTTRIRRREIRGGSTARGVSGRDGGESEVRRGVEEDLTQEGHEQEGEAGHGAEEMVLPTKAAAKAEGGLGVVGAMVLAVRSE